MEKLPNGSAFYFPKIRNENLRKRYDEEISKAINRVTFIELYQSRFYINRIVENEDEEQSNLN